MGHWEFGGEGINSGSCSSTGQAYTHNSQAEPFFERSTAGFPCPYMAIRIDGQLFQPFGSVYGFQPGTEFKRYVPAPGETTKKTYDCINSKCIENAQGNGFFKSLEDCQLICAWSCTEGKQCIDPNTYCPPGKICLESSEYSQITQLISRISQDLCG